MDRMSWYWGGYQPSDACFVISRPTHAAPSRSTYAAAIPLRSCAARSVRIAPSMLPAVETQGDMRQRVIAALARGEI